MKMHGRIAPVACLAAIAAAGAPASSAAADLTVFIAESSPTEPWKTGFGAAIGASLLGLVTIEGEAARLPGQASDASMTSFGLGGFLSPPIGGVIPYGGLVVGLYRQSVGPISQTDFLTGLALGLKLNLGRVFVLRGEFRSLKLPSDALIEVDKRFSIGAGIQF